MYKFLILPLEPNFIPKVFGYQKICIDHFLWLNESFNFLIKSFLIWLLPNISVLTMYIFSLEKTSSGMFYVFCERRKIQPPLWSFGRSRPYKVFIKPFWQGKNLHSNNTIQLHVLITWCVLILYNHQEHSKYIQFEDIAYIWQRVVNASSEG